MICPKCGLRQTSEAGKCSSCGVTFSKITISSWESVHASAAKLWWNEPRELSKKSKPSEFIKLIVSILIASAFSFVWFRKLSINPFLVLGISLVVGTLAVLVLKLLDSSTPNNIYLTPTEIVRAHGREQDKLQYQDIKSCLFVQHNQEKVDNHLEITKHDDQRRFFGIPNKLDPADVIAVLNTYNVKCE